MKNKVTASQHEQYGSYTLISVLLPLVGFILGIVYMTKDQAVDKKLGEHLLVISVLFSFVYWFAYAWYVNSAIGV